MVHRLQATPAMQRKGEIINFNLTKANVDDRNENVMNALIDKAFGKLYADKGYISQTLLEDFGIKAFILLQDFAQT